jgi:hypothetical protein
MEDRGPVECGWKTAIPWSVDGRPQSNVVAESQEGPEGQESAADSDVEPEPR